MRASEASFVLQGGKKFFLILCLFFLVAGSSLIIVYSSPTIKPYKVFTQSVNVTVTNGGYFSNDFQAVRGDWIGFNLAATNRSFLQVRAFGLPLTQNSMVYSVDHSFDENAALHGVNYNGTFSVNITTSYYVELDNWASHSPPPNPSNPYEEAIYDSNTFSGNFSLLRMPNYYKALPITGVALLAASCGCFLVPLLSYFRFKAKRLGINL